jgi:putative sigma-54 modulation protein
MPVDVTVRYKGASESALGYARSKGEKLVEDFPRVEHVHVIIDKQKREHIVEVVVQAKNHIRLESEDASENLRASIDSAAEKAERQLRRHRDRIQEKRHRAGAVHPGERPPEEEETKP